MVKVVPVVIGLLAVASAGGQVNVLTGHNDSGRTGQNLNETILTPSNVTSGQFGKLFTQAVGEVHGQPLYVSNLALPGKGVHNVVFAGAVSTIYAFDADSNGGANASPLWKTSVLAGAGSVSTAYTITGTPVIDLATRTMYIACLTKDNGVLVFRLHALDITTGAEKFGAPVVIQGSVPGTGSGSSGGVLAFDPSLHVQRPALLLQNGVVYVPFGSHSDMGAWHGWIFSYNAATLKQIDIFCTSRNGSGGGIWMGGSGLAGEVNDPNKPFGRMFFATGNGSYNAALPYDNTMSYSMSVLDLDLNGGVMTAKDIFTPHDEVRLNSQDGDLGSGGSIFGPTQTLTGGGTFDSLIQVGKHGTIVVFDRNHLGGFNTASDQVVSEVQTPPNPTGTSSWGAGVWGAPAYWNQNLYFGGTNPGSSTVPTNSVTAYSILNGQLSPAPTSQTAQTFAYPGPTPSVSANGTQSGIVWVMKADSSSSGAPEVLLAYDATNLANLLYSSNTNLARDNPGTGRGFLVPTVANGKVYVGSKTGLSIYGLLVPALTPPQFNPPAGTFTGSESVSITDATAGAQIYYTTDGSTPTTSSNLFAGSITVNSTETITAIASATGYLQSQAAAATYTSTGNAASPVFSLASGSYSGAQSLSLSDSSSGASIYYTVDGSTPTTSSPLYKNPIPVKVNETVSAMATAPGLLPSSVVTATYAITSSYTFDFSQGFAQAAGPMQFNGSTGLDDFRLQLTNGGQNEASSAFYATPVNISAFVTDFTIQLSNPLDEGMTFTIQNYGPTAVGAAGSGLGFQGIGAKSVAIKFDLNNNAGEGSDSTGMYFSGVAPTVPSIDLTGSGIDLHSGDYINVHITYDGTMLNLTLTDAVSLASWSQSFAVNIPGRLQSQTGYVGFTASTSSGSSSQKVTSWTYLAGKPVVPSYPLGFDVVGISPHGTAALSGTAMQLTNGGAGSQAASFWYKTQVDATAFTTDFDFQLTQAAADGFAFVLQTHSSDKLGAGGAGLGYQGLLNSVAIKFDLFNNAGEGTDSTGVYVNGASPTVPSIDLTPSHLQLNSGDVIHAHIVYDGTTLTWTLTDKTYYLHFSSTQKVVLNIPNTIGSNTAYVGFTASSGADGAAQQKILDWTFSNP